MTNPRQTEATYAKQRKPKRVTRTKQMHFLFFFVFVLAAKLNKADTSNCLGCGAKKKKNTKQMETNEGRERKKDSLVFKSHDSFPCDF